MPLKIIAELKDTLPGRVLSEEAALLSFSYDASHLTGSPWAIVQPETKEEVLEVLRLAQKYRCPIITRGAGTSTTGSAVPFGGGIVLSTVKLNRILDLYEEDQVVRCQPGVITGDLKNLMKRYGLFYPPDPSSYNFSTIGGNVATGAGGSKGLKYGTTKDYVLALEVGLPGGRLIRTGPPTLKKSSYYNLTPLFVGSEGTLGVILELWLKLIPYPERRALFLVKAKEEKALLHLVNNILKGGIVPSSAEFIDQTSLQALRQRGVPFLKESDSGLLFLEIDGKACCVATEVERVKRIIENSSFTYLFSQVEEEMETLWELRRSLSPSLRCLGPKKIADDVVIPRRHNLQFLEYLRTLEEKSSVKISAFGHVGDGNFHVNLYFEKESEGEAKVIREKIIKKVWEFSGTVSGEHGIGFTKKPYFALELTEEELILMGRLKSIFDPDNLLNPGVKIP